jgi:hypothetical protein
MVRKRGAKACLKVESDLSEQGITDVEEHGGWFLHS